MLFFVFFLILLVFFEFFVLNSTTLYLLYLIYFIVFILNYSNTNIVSNVNFKYSLKFFFIKLFSLFYVLLFKFFTLLPFFRKSNQLRWKPLFKKSSYFGLYRSTRNQYLNK